MYLGSWKTDDVLTFTVNTHKANTGVATAADSAPTYRVYEDETATPILTGTMATLDPGNATGFYSEQITLSAANGFEKGKSYSVRIAATVDGVAGATVRTFQMEAEVDANTVSPTVNANVTQFGGANGTFASGIPAVNTTLIEGSDATNQIRDAVVDDATRIDASALNTLSSHDPGETIMGATDLGTGSGFTSLASAASLSAVASNVSDILTDTGTTIPGQISGLNNLSSADVSGAVWNAATASYGSAGSYGLLVETNLDATVSSRLASGSYTAPDNAGIVAIKAVTDNIPDSGSMTSIATASALATVDSNVDAILDDTGTSGVLIAANAIGATQIASNAITSAKIASGAIGATQIAANAIGASELAADAVAEIADGVLDELLSGHTTAGSLGKAIADIEANATAILADTNELQTNQGNWVTATGFSTHSAGDVVTAMQAVANDFKADVSGLATAAALATVDSNVDAILVDTDTTIPGLISGLSIPSASAVADAVWDEATSGHTTAGTTGKALADAGSAGDPWATSLPGSYSAGQAGYIIGTNLNATVSSRLASASYTAPDNSSIAAILTDTGTTIPAQISGLNNLSAAQVNAEVDQALADYDGPTNAEMEARTITAANYATAAALATVDTVVDGIAAKTSSLTFTVAGQVDANIQYVNDTQVSGTGTDVDPWNPA